MIASSYMIPGYTVVTTSDGMHLLVPQPRVPIAVDFASMTVPEPVTGRWLVPQRLGGIVPNRPQQVIVVSDPAASGIEFRRRSRRGFAPPRKRPRRVAKRIAARDGRMHYPKGRT